MMFQHECPSYFYMGFFFCGILYSQIMSAADMFIVFLVL